MNNARRFVLCAILTGSLCAPGAATAQIQVVSQGAPKPSNRPLLVKCDIELADWLQNARHAIEKKEYAEAIRILQALIEKEDSGFVSVDKSNQRFVSLREQAVELLGSMPPEALEPYRRLYDPKAQRKYEQALQAGDLSALAMVAQQYRNTSYGPKALEALAAAQFDRGQFVQAAETWRGLLKSADSDAQAMLLTKIAVAYHLAGQPDLAEKFAQRLRRDYPGVQAVLAGNSQDLGEFLAGVFRRPALQAPHGPIAAGYPGWGGVPNGVGVMAENRAVLRPHWRYPPAQDDENLLNHVVARADLGAPTEGNSRKVPLARLRQGAVVVRSPFRNQQSTAVLPAMLRPVISDNWAIYRDDEGVVAVDLLSGRCDGKFGWKSQPLPMQRTLEDKQSRDMGQMVFMGRWSGETAPMLIDRGRYGLTIGGGRLYAVGNFPPPVFYRGDSTVEETGSTLAALSLSGEGKLVWRVGWTKDDQRGGDEVLRHCTYLCPPTYVPDPADPDGGRLYVLAIYTESYYLLCLDARTGRGIWKTQVAQTPVTGEASYGYDWNSWVKTIGTPPAVADGKVFVATNAGVVAAFDAQVGHPLWAYQYAGESAALRPGVRPRLPSSSRRVNPIIASQGRVVCMPADAADVFALDAGNGAPAWKIARDSSEILTAVDTRRICIAGTGLKILDLLNGKTLFETSAVNCRLGHPAVTNESILLCDEGTLHRIRLKDYSIESQPVQPGGLVGNLVSVEGKLIAANPLGLCAYFNYEHAWDLLTRNIQKASPEQRIDWLFQRASLSFSDGRYEIARKDFEDCRSLVQSLRDEARKYSLESQLRQRLYQTWVAIGNRAPQPAEALKAYRQAQRLARTGQEKAHMLIRLAKFHETIGEFSQAVEQAQQVLQNFPQDGLVDVRIGPEADDRAVLGQNQPTLPGRQWAEAFILRLIEIHGPAIYAKFDAQAKAELDATRSDPQALLAMADRWPLSRCADDARFAAAEMLYRQAQTGPSENRAARLQKTEEILRDLGQRKISPHRPSALVMLMILYQSAGQGVLARQVRMDMAGLPPETPIAFAGIRGSLGDVLHQLDGGKIATLGTLSPAESNDVFLRPPLRILFSVSDRLAYLLSDQTYQPIRIGPNLLVQRGEKTILWSTSATRPEDFEVLVAVTRPNAELGKLNPVLSRGGLIASTDKTGAVAVLCGWERSMAFQTDSGKLLWMHPHKDFKIQNHGSYGIGNDLLVLCDSTGNVAAVDILGGALRWKATIPTQPNLPQRHTSPVLGNGGVAILSQTKNHWALFLLDSATGKLLLRETSPHVIQTYATTEGDLLVLHSGRLRLYKSPDFRKPAAEVDFDPAGQPGVLDVSKDYIAVAPDRNGSEIRLYRPADLVPVPVTFPCREGKAQVPVDVAFSENRVFVLCSGDIDTPPTSSREEEIRSNGLAICCFDPNSGEFLWYAPLLSPRGRETIYILSRLQIGRDHLVVTARNRLADHMGTCFIVNRHTGKLVQTFVLNNPGGGRNQDYLQRHGSIGRVTIAKNRLFVETMNGISVYGGQ